MRGRLGTDATWTGTVEHASPDGGETCEIAVQLQDLGTCAVAQLAPVTESGAAQDALVVVPHWQRAGCKPETLKQHLKFLPSSERSRVAAALGTALPQSATDHLVVTLSGPTDGVAYNDFQLVLARAVLVWLSDRTAPKAVNS